MTTMDFFGHQEQAQRSSRRLVWLFAAAVLGIVATLYAIAVGLLTVADQRTMQGPIHWPLLLAVAAGTLSIVGLASLVKTAQLRSGGAHVAKMLGGRELDADPKDPKERLLRNVVEEMAIASGVPVPTIFVLDREAGINAFAAGWSPTDAAVAVTRGALDAFDRDELQGVIAHEFSHVFHGDMRLNIRLMGVLFGIVCIAALGRIVLHATRHSRGDKKGGTAAILLFGLAMVVVGYLGVLFARLIQAAVSRQREYLADASAVQYTRNPRGIGLALARIGGIGGRLQSARTEEASHMLFADGMKRFAAGFATHPPIEERIERVLPGFRKQLLKAKDPVAAVAATPAPAVAGAAGFAGAGRRTTPEALVQSVGDPGARHVEAARAMLAELPLALRLAAHEPDDAAALALALLLDRDDAARHRQSALLKEGGGDVAHAVHVRFDEVRSLPRQHALPLLELAMPALRRLPTQARADLRRRARALALADGRISPAEFGLLKLLERHLLLDGEAPPRPRNRPTGLVERAADACFVLSVLAHVGAGGDPARAERAFAAGLQALATSGDWRLQPEPPSLHPRFDAAIDALATLSPLGKRNLLLACAKTAAVDGTIDADEADLLRTLGELWDCPVPLVT
jgi:Zn-dependent protease with chaperone function